jgi:hypothetical protein
MSTPQPYFVKTWFRTFFWIGMVPATTCLALGMIPGGQMLTLIPAFFLSLPGALLVGPPHFSPEFGLPMTAVGISITVITWLAISALVASVLAAVKGNGGGQ